jgi:hypothetical protein
VINQQRDDYLRALGVVQYVIKSDESLVVDSNTVPRDLKATELEETLSLAPANLIAPPLPPIEGPKPLEVADEFVDDAPKVVMNDVSLVSHSLSLSAPETAVELKFALWQPAPEILLISDIGAALPNGQQLELLSNLLLAIDIRPQNMATMDIIEWPPLPNTQGDEAQVREFLSTVVETRIAQSLIGRIVLLGDVPRYWLCIAEQTTELREGRFVRADGVCIDSLPSLEAMLLYPQEKCHAWQVLQP